jgi:transcriptional regulator with XRE-family HTH domain
MAGRSVPRAIRAGGEFAPARSCQHVGRFQTNVSHWRRNDGPRWSAPYYLEWAITVGDRIRRLRRDRDWTLGDLALRVPKPEGGCFSLGYFSRLERGWGSAPLYTYIKIAEAFEVDPGRLLGPEDVQLEVTPQQAMLLKVLEHAAIEPAEAIVRLTSEQRL